MSQDETSQLSHDIEIVSMTLSHQIQSHDQATMIRDGLPTALKLLVVAPLMAIAIQLFRWATGGAADWFFSWAIWIALTVAIPLGWIFLRALTHRIEVSRHRALLAADNQIGSAERLATADHFMRQPEPDGFMRAAIEDAAPWSQRAREASLAAPDRPTVSSRWTLWPVPLAMIALALAATLSHFARIPGTPQTNLDPVASPSLPTTILPTPERAPQQPPKNQLVEPKPTEKTPDQPRSQRAANRQGMAGTAIPNEAEESQGRLSEGETRESQQSANPSSARGAPSNSGQPSKSDEEAKRESKPKPKKKPDETRKPNARPQEEQPSGATAGQGSSKGSDNNAAPSDWASTSQTATPDDEDIEDEEDVADEEEEQESRGGVQPNLRDRRTPVNRDLQIGFGNAQPNPDANGRGGPGGQKKSRGVASLVLGVPIPDRVNGQPNKGRIRITQQRITPEAEQSDPVAAQDRAPRQDPIGPIFHPDFSPWLQDYVRRYFLQRRARYPLNSSAEEANTDANTQESLQTSATVESELPSS